MYLYVSDNNDLEVIVSLTASNKIVSDIIQKPSTNNTFVKNVSVIQPLMSYFSV